MNMHREMLAAILLFAASLGCAQTVEYIHTDALGSPVAITNASGEVIERTVYEPYGAVMNRPLNNRPGYTGHVEDAVTGLNYMQQRYYDPQVGRFLSNDPVTATSAGANLNRYWYANNNPYRFTDPDGRCPRTAFNVQCYYFGDSGNQGGGSGASQTSSGDSAVDGTPQGVKGPGGMDSVGGPDGAAAAEIARKCQGDVGCTTEQALLHLSLLPLPNLPAGLAWTQRLFAPRGATQLVHKESLIFTQGRTMTRKELEVLKQDIAQNGIKETIKYVEVNGQKFIVDGHHRVIAARQLGIENVPAEAVQLPYGSYKTVADLVSGW